MSRFNQIVAKFLADWSHTPVTLQNLEFKDHTDLEVALLESDSAFVFLEVKNDVRLPVGPGSDTIRRQYGAVQLNVYTKTGIGSGEAQELGSHFATMYEGKTVDSVRYRNFSELTPYRDRGWYVSPFVITFDHD